MRFLSSKVVQLSLTVMLVAGVVAGAQIETMEKAGYTYRGRLIELRVDAGRLALIDGEPADLEAASLHLLEHFGVQSRPAPSGHPGIHVLRLSRRIGIRDAVSSLATVSHSAFVSPILLDERGRDVFVTSTIALRFSKDVGLDAARALLSPESPERVKGSYCGLAGVYALRPVSRSAFDLLDLANELARRPDVAFAEPVKAWSGDHCDTSSNDPHYASQWHLANHGQPGGGGVPGVAGMDVQASRTWYATRGSPAAAVVVIDSGIELNHPDLNVLPGTETVMPPSTTPDGSAAVPLDNHGTLVAGVISARLNNFIGVAGVAPNSPVISVRAGFTTGVANNPATYAFNATDSAIATAIAWAAAAPGARMTVSAFSIAVPSATIDMAYMTTWNSGIVHFVASGNAGTPTLSYPASLTSLSDFGPVIAIGAIDRFGNRPAFGSHGPALDLCAPGVEIRTTDRQGSLGANTGASPGGDYALTNGTSMACAVAAGVAALQLALNPSLTPAQLEAQLRATARDLGAAGRDGDFGFGLVQAGLSVAPNLPAHYLGRISPTAPATSVGFSRGLDGGADFNGDGTPDIVVGATDFTVTNAMTSVTEDYHGTVFAMSGKDGSQIWEFDETIGVDPRVGFSVAIIGDVNGDQVPDIATGAPRRRINSTPHGSVVMIDGATGNRMWETVAAVAPSADFGLPVARIGDISGVYGTPLMADGIPDVLVGAANHGFGAVFVLDGLTGNIRSQLSNPLLQNSHFGQSISAIGDVDGDGVEDFVVGAPNEHYGSILENGSVRAFSGGTLTQIWAFFGTPSGPLNQEAWLGTRLIAVGDVNGDGLCDVAATAPKATILGVPTRMGLYLISGFDGARLLEYDAGDSPNPYWSDGSAGLAAIGDYDLDGAVDVAVGIPSFAAPGVPATSGTVKIVSNAGVLLWSFDGDRAAGIGGQIASCGDIDGDCRPDIVVGGTSDSFFATTVGSAIVFKSSEIVPAAEICDGYLPDLVMAGNTYLGNPGQPPLNILRINSSSGGPTSAVGVNPGGPVVIEMLNPPGGPGSPFLLFTRPGIPLLSELTPIGPQIAIPSFGTMYFDPIANSLLVYSTYGGGLIDGNLATPLVINAGNPLIPSGFRFTLQGIVVDALSVGLLRVTNGILLNFR